MKVVVAVDSFKGSMTSMEAGMAVKEGILAAKKDAEVVVKPLADGGEAVSYTHLRAHETPEHLVCRLKHEKK